MMHSTFPRFFFLLFSLWLAGSALAVTPLTDEEAGDNRDARSARPPRSRAPQNRSSTVVVIDAGHGGFDRGGIPRQAVPEKAMTLDVSLRLRSVLEKSGYRVVMTRDRDVFVSLPGRVAIANSYNNAIFVCVHFNSATRVGANGIETYFYSRESLPLASAIHYNVAAGAPSPNRGVRRRGYYVLRKTRIPAVLVECGFLTNPTEARYVQDSRYRQKLAEEIGRGIGARSSVTTSSTRLTDDGRVPLQPFIDQTRARDRESSRSSHKSSKKKSKKSKRLTSSDSDEPSPPTKKKKKKSADASDSENARPKKKSSSEQTEN
ncbi:MAG: N-acetylmuramoyl-L-alanine amidase [Spartobacteria bacterium]|nr:N-acetylmuramoyl-L-alanine amidase [Spartobacteria bacterium]